MHFDPRGTAVLNLGPKGLFTLILGVFGKFVDIAIIIVSFLIAHFSEAENTLVLRRIKSFAFACLNLNKIPAKDPKVLNTVC